MRLKQGVASHTRAEADAKRIELIAKATGEGISKVAPPLRMMAESKPSTCDWRSSTLYSSATWPRNQHDYHASNVADVAGLIATAMSTVRETK